MLRAVILVATLFVSGCAADIHDLRMPETPGEQAAVDLQIKRAEKPAARLAQANGDLCRKIPRADCGLSLLIAYSWKANAFSNQAGIYFSTGMMEALKTDDGIAMIMAHEWSHVLLEHYKKRGTGDMEIDADCVGAILTYRAGYDLTAAKVPFETVFDNIDTGQTAYSIAMLLLIGAIPESGYHPSAAWRAEHIDHVAAELAVRKARGDVVNQSAIETICSIKFPAPPPLDVSGLKRVE